MLFYSNPARVVYELRLYIHLILSCTECSFVTLWATVCSSWVRINTFTSCRSILLPEGDCQKYYIQKANQMMSRILPTHVLLDI